jgi:hypothetical protein
MGMLGKASLLAILMALPVLAHATNTIDKARQYKSTLPPRAAAAAPTAPSGPDITEKKGRSISRASMDRVVREHRAESLYCYEQATKASDRCGDVVTLQLDIDKSGKVSAAHAVDHQGEAVATCLETAVRRWRFPEATATTSMMVPFAFSAQ